MNPLNLLGGLQTYVIPIVAALSFGAGLYTSNIWHGYKENKLVTQVQEQLIKQDITNRKTIGDLQSTLAITEDNYNFVKGQLNEIKITNTPCKLTPAAVRLWNKSGKVSKLPKDSSRAVETTPTPSGIENKPIEGVDIKLVFDNKIENDKICNQLRDQINSIIKWDVDTYGNN